MRRRQLIVIILALCLNASAGEYHVAKSGNDKNDGKLETPFLSIQAAANVAQPGDIISAASLECLMNEVQLPGLILDPNNLTRLHLI